VPPLLLPCCHPPLNNPLHTSWPPLCPFSVSPPPQQLSIDILLNQHFGCVCCAVCVCRVCCRPQRKKVHWSMHSLACLCAVLGLIAAWKSHTLKVIVQDTLMSHILACLAEQWLTASHFLPLRHLKHGSDGPIGMPGDFTAVMHCVIPLAA
jgi:hypothetical protein